MITCQMAVADLNLQCLRQVFHLGATRHSLHTRRAICVVMDGDGQGPLKEFYP